MGVVVGARWPARLAGLALATLLAAPGASAEPPPLQVTVQPEMLVLGDPAPTSLSVDLGPVDALLGAALMPSFTLSSGRLRALGREGRFATALYEPPPQRMPGVALIVASLFVDDGRALHGATAVELVARTRIEVQAPAESIVSVSLDGTAPVEATLAGSTTTTLKLVVPRGATGYTLLITERDGSERRERVELGLPDAGALTLGPAPDAAWILRHGRIELALAAVSALAAGEDEGDPTCSAASGRALEVTALTSNLWRVQDALDTMRGEASPEITCRRGDLQTVQRLTLPVLVERNLVAADTLPTRPHDQTSSATGANETEEAVPHHAVAMRHPNAREASGWSSRLGVGVGWLTYGGPSAGTGAAVAITHAAGPGAVRLLTQAVLASCASQQRVHDAALRDEWWSAAASLGISAESSPAYPVSGLIGFGVGAVSLDSRATATRQGVALQPEQRALLVAPQHTVLAEAAATVGDVTLRLGARWQQTLAFFGVPASTAFVGTVGVGYAFAD